LNENNNDSSQATQDQILLNHEKQLSDHETRLRWIERVVGYGIGGIAVVKWLYESTFKHTT
jgi:hypothetical protein